MRGLLVILLLVVLCIPAYAAGTLQLKAADTFIATHDVPDSTGEAYTPADSVQVTVTFQDATEALAATWFNNADAQGALVNGNLYFFDAWDDMNGTDGVGTYTVLMRWYDGSGAALDFEETYIVQQTTIGLEATYNEVGAILDTLQLWDTRIDSIEAALADVNIGDKTWTDGTPASRVAVIDSINAILDSLQLYDGRWALAASMANAIDSINGILDSLQLWDDEISTPFWTLYNYRMVGLQQPQH